MFKLKIYQLVFIVMCLFLHFDAQAQASTVKGKSTTDTSISTSARLLKNLTGVRTSFCKTWNKTFVNFTDNNVSLLAGMSFSKQTIKDAGYNSSFNYNLNDYNKNEFKPGFLAGLRIDGKYNKVHDYSLAFSLNKIAAGTNYKESGSLAPFIGTFSHFKADEHFFNLSIAAHYKKLIPIVDTSKYKLFVVVGPSLDTRLSGQSTDNLVNNNYQRFLLRGDLGLEFDNHGYYTLFMHYKQGITSFTKSPIHTNMNSVELGMMMKLNDIF